MNDSGKRDLVIDFDRYEAAIFDLDGVVTDSAKAHAESWKRMFDEYLKERSEREEEKFIPFDARSDYLKYVDGKPRYQGAGSFLESRGISLPFGDPEDPPGKETVCGLGNLENRYFLELINIRGVESYQTTVDFVQKIQKEGIRAAVISSSRNAAEVLEAAGVTGLFQVMIDGGYAAEHGLKGKPEPDIFLEAAGKLKADPERAIVIEDAISGVKAGKAGGFTLVIGVDRSGKNRNLERYGADISVSDLSQIRSERE